MLDLSHPTVQNVICLVAIGLAAWVLYRIITPREGFAKEFVDNSNEEKTEKTRASSYKQETNSFKPTVAPPEPIPGILTPFRVNMFQSYVPA